MQVGTSSKTVFRTRAIERAHNRAVDFCRTPRKDGIIACPEGVALINYPYLAGPFEVRVLTGTIHTLENHSLPAPVFAKEQDQLQSTKEIFLSAKGEHVKETLASLIKHNLPDSPSNLPVRTIKMQALSPTTEFWLRWVHAEEKACGEFSGMVVLGDNIRYQKRITSGANDFFDILNVGQTAEISRPFSCRSQDVVGTENAPSRVRLFLLPAAEGIEILELDVRIYASSLGNFSLIL